MSVYNIELLQGGIEIKTVTGFLTRTNDHNEPSGSLGFELWTDKEKKHKGWLWAMMYPE